MGDRQGGASPIREARQHDRAQREAVWPDPRATPALHAHHQLSPEAHEQFMDAVEVMLDYRENCLPRQGSIRDDVHLLDGEAALPKMASCEGSDELL